MDEQRGEGFYRDRYEQYRKNLAESEQAERERMARVKPLIEDIVLAASYDAEIIRTVAGAANRLEALQAMQGLLPERFPKLLELPEPAVAGIPSNRFLAAKETVRLLWKEPKR